MSQEVSGVLLLSCMTQFTCRVDGTDPTDVTLKWLVLILFKDTVDYSLQHGSITVCCMNITYMADPLRCNTGGLCCRKSGLYTMSSETS